MLDRQSHVRLSPLSALVQAKTNSFILSSAPEPFVSLIPNGSTEIKPVKLLPVGPAYLAHVRRSIHNHSFEEHDKHEEERRKRVKNDEGDANEKARRTYTSESIARGMLLVLQLVLMRVVKVQVK